MFFCVVKPVADGRGSTNDVVVAAAAKKQKKFGNLSRGNFDSRTFIPPLNHDQPLQDSKSTNDTRRAQPISTWKGVSVMPTVR
jgi:hypothetical protein